MGDIIGAIGQFLFELIIWRLQIYFYGDNKKTVPALRLYFLWFILTLLSCYLITGFYAWLTDWVYIAQYYSEASVIAVFFITLVFLGAFMSGENQRNNKLRAYISALTFIIAAIIGIYIAVN